MKESTIIHNKRKEKLRIIEVSGLVIFSICALIFALAIIIRHQSLITVFAAVITIATMWYLYFNNLFDYNFRITIIAIAEALVVFSYAYFADTFLNCVIPIVVCSVLHILYKNKLCLMIDELFAVFIAILHLYKICINPTDFAKNFAFLIIQLLAVMLIQYMAILIINAMDEDAATQDELLEALSDAEEVKNDFMANMSHELRTPINSILGTSSILLDHPLPDADKDYLFSLEESGNKLLSIVNDIMDYTMINSSKLVLNETPYIITSIINDTASFVNSRNKNKNISVFFDVDPLIPSSLLGDCEKITRIIFCLLDNAFKFTHAGTISLKVSSRKVENRINLCIKVTDTGIGMDDETLDHLRTGIFAADAKSARRHEGAGLGLSVANGMLSLMNGFLLIDSEIGKGSEFTAIIPQAVLNSSPSVVLEHNTSYKLLVYANPANISIKNFREQYIESLENMMANLHINSIFVKNMAELKSNIEIDRFSHILLAEKAYLEEKEYFDNIAKKVNIIVTLREGSADNKPEFIRKLYMPFYAYHLAELLMHDKDIKPSTYQISTKKFVSPKSKVLIVDDNKTNLKVIEGLLKKYKISSILCRSGAEALEKCQEKNYNFIFMDHMMPDMDGIETMQNIKKLSDPFFRRVPIIALTANAVSGAREMFLSEGFDDFVSKPINKRELERILFSYLPAENIEYIIEVPNEIHPSISLSKNDSSNDVVKETTVIEEFDKILLDIDKDKALELLNDDEEIYSDAVNSYINDSTDYIEKLPIYYASKNWKDYSIIAHAIKSSSQSIGAFNLSNLAAELEELSKTEKMNDTAKMNSDLLEAYKQLLSILRKQV